jgi:hypothetical protein
MVKKCYDFNAFKGFQNPRRGNVAFFGISSVYTDECVSHLNLNV